MKSNFCLFLFSIAVILSACHQNQEAQQGKNDIAFEWIDDIKFPIDSETFFAPDVHGYSLEIQKLFIWNEYNSSIYLFDLDKKESTRKIPLELGPSTGLNNVDYIHFQSEDSIFLLDERSKRLFLHIPSKSYYSGQQILGFESDDPVMASGGVLTHFYIDKAFNAYMSTKPAQQRTNPEKISTLVRYNFTSGSREFVGLYPQYLGEYIDDHAKIYGSSSFTFAPQLNKLLLSLAYYHEILVLDTLGNLVDRVPSEARRMEPYQGRRDPLSPPSGDWEITEAFWRDIVYDPFNQLFYHVGHVSYYYRDLNGNREDGKTIYGDSSYQVFNVFDANLNKLAEIPSDFSGEIFKMIPTPIGILALWPNPLDEDHLVFRVFKVNRLAN
jgi:hypothetical protein